MMSKGLGRFQRTVLGTLIEGVEPPVSCTGRRPFWLSDRDRRWAYRGAGNDWMPLRALQAALYGVRNHPRAHWLACIGPGNKANLSRALGTLQVRGLVAERWHCPGCGQVQS